MSKNWGAPTKFWGIKNFNKKSELMLMRGARAYGSFCSEVILVYQTYFLSLIHI